MYQAWWCKPLIIGGRDRQISLSSRPAWSKKQVPGQSRLHRETLCPKKKCVYRYDVCGEHEWATVCEVREGLHEALLFFPLYVRSGIGHLYPLSYLISLMSILYAHFPFLPIFKLHFSVCVCVCVGMCACVHTVLALESMIQERHCGISLHGQGKLLRSGRSGVSLHGGPKWPLCEAVQVKPGVCYRSQDAGDARVVGCLPKRAANRECAEASKARRDWVLRALWHQTWRCRIWSLPC